jgi:hypothetical protein
MVKTIIRISVAEIASRSRSRAPGYAEALFAAGTADRDGTHWLIPLEALREVWKKYGAPGLDLEHGGGCEGCGQ